MMADLLTTVLFISLALHVVFIGVAVWRVWRGENFIDRLLGLDLVATLTVSVIILISLLQGESRYLDVAIGLAALGFIAAVALSRYVVDEQVY